MKQNTTAEYRQMKEESTMLLLKRYKKIFLHKNSNDLVKMD